MIFSAFIYTSVFLAYGLQRYRPGVILAISLMPVYLIQAIQPGVGTDYYSYLEIINSPNTLEFFWEKNEYLFYLIAKSINHLLLPPQSLFAVYSFLFYLLTVLNLKLISRNIPVNPFVLVILYLLCNNQYFTQYSGIRYSLSALNFSLGLFYFRYGSLKRSLFYSLLSVLAHKIGFVFAFITYASRLAPKFVLQLKSYIYVPFLFYFIAEIVVPLGMKFLFPGLTHYLDGQHNTEVSSATVAVRIYTLFMLYGALIFIRLKRLNLQPEDGLFGLLGISAFWAFLLTLQFSFMFRFEIYLGMFKVFYLAFLYMQIIKVSPNLGNFWIFLLSIPGISKILFFAKGEYFYDIGIGF